MTTYKVKTGHDQALISLVAVAPQPMSEGIKPTRRTFAADGAVYDEARYVELEFSNVGSVTAYQALLTQFGILSVTSFDVTVYVRSETFAWVRMNGTAVRPEPGREVQWRRFFPRNVTILIKDLTAAS
jgi:hypothetical protein